ncbi:complement regulator-acquiring protein, partial [Borreliella valaisiana]
TNTKLNIIKLNIITAILTLIFISCAPINKIGPKPKNYTNPKENTRNFKNASQDLEPSNQKNQDLGPSNQKSRETIISKLEAIGKKLKAQKEQENIEIAKIAQSNFLNDFQINFYDTIRKDWKNLNNNVFLIL